MRKKSYPINLERNTHKYFLEILDIVNMDDNKYAKKYKKKDTQFYDFTLKRLFVDDEDDFLNEINFYQIIGTNKIILSKSFVSLLKDNDFVFKVDSSEILKPYIRFIIDRHASKENYKAKMANPFNIPKQQEPEQQEKVKVYNKRRK